jgi:hypothetical protein
MEDLVEVHLVLLLQILVHHAANAATKTENHFSRNQQIENKITSLLRQFERRASPLTPED